MSFRIRRAVHSDSIGIIQSHRRSIREVCLHDYNKAQIAAWSGRDFQVSRWHQSIDKDMVWVVVDSKENVFGFGHAQIFDGKKGHLAGLYFAPEVIGLGLGKEITDLMKNEWKAKGASEVTLLATITSKKFYEKIGFLQVGEIAKISLGDQNLDCFNMRLKL